MKRAAVGVVVFVAVLAAGCGATRTVTKTVTVSSAESGPGPPRETVQFGYIESLRPQGRRGFVLRFDPALLLSGVTANTAAAEDGAVQPGEPVPNDDYVVNEGHRLLTYLVPANAQVTVLTRGGDPGRLGATPVTVAQLARIVDGSSRLELFEPITTGFWIRIRIDTVTALDQQYQP